jgi:hypothetical protein
MKMKEVLYVPRSKNNLLSISSLNEKGYRVAFFDGKVIMWPRGNTFYYVVVTGVQ